MFLSGVAVGIIMSIIASTASANSLQCFTKQKPSFDALGSQGWVLLVQSNPVNTDTEGTIESVRINRVEFREM